jgi:hypothetical protein
MPRRIIDEGTEQLIRDTVKRRASIALIEGLNIQAGTIFSDMASLIVLISVILIFGRFVPAIRIGFLGLAIIISTVSLYMYHRKLEKAEIDRSKSREACLKEIAETRKELPRELEFLTDLDD